MCNDIDGSCGVKAVRIKPEAAGDGRLCVGMAQGPAEQPGRVQKAAPQVWRCGGVQVWKVQKGAPQVSQNYTS